MSVEQRFRDAYVDLDELMGQGVSIADAIAQAAMDNGLATEVLRARAERHLGDLEAYRERIMHRIAWAESERKGEEAFAEREQEVRQAAAASAEHTYYACNMDEADPGRPSWPLVVERIIAREQLSDARLIQAVWAACYETVERLDRKHGRHNLLFPDRRANRRLRVHHSSRE